MPNRRNCEPGRYYRILAKAEEIQRTGGGDTTMTGDDMRELIAQLRRQAS